MGHVRARVNLQARRLPFAGFRIEATMVRATDGTATAKKREPIEDCRERLFQLARLLQRYQGPAAPTATGRRPGPLRSWTPFIRRRRWPCTGS